MPLRGRWLSQPPKAWLALSHSAGLLQADGSPTTLGLPWRRDAFCSPSGHVCWQKLKHGLRGIPGCSATQFTHTVSADTHLIQANPSRRYSRWGRGRAGPQVAVDRTLREQNILPNAPEASPHPQSPGRFFPTGKLRTANEDHEHIGGKTSPPSRTSSG